MKKIIASLVVCSISLGAFAWHGHGGFHHGGFHHVGYHHWHSGYHGWHGGWGRAGCNFWPGFVGGVVGGVVGTAITTPYYRSSVVVTPAPTIVQNPAPVIVQQPTVIQNPAPIVVQNPTTVVTPQVTEQQVIQKIWVNGRYVDRTDSNGNVIRVWEPGHWEYR